MDINDYMVQKRLKDKVISTLVDIKQNLVNRRGFYKMLDDLNREYTTSMDLTEEEADEIKRDMALIQAELETVNKHLFEAEDWLFVELMAHDAMEDSISAAMDDFAESLQNVEAAANKVIRERY